MKTNKQIKNECLKELKKICNEYPYLRIGQIIGNICGLKNLDYYYINDSELLVGLKETIYHEKIRKNTKRTA